MATRSSRTKTTRLRLPLAELSSNPTCSKSPTDRDADVINKLTTDLDSATLNENSPTFATPCITSKSSKKPINAKTCQPEYEPTMVRRSRRGDKAISNHPLVGKYRVEITSSEKRWCGKFALGISTEAQLGERLTVEAFDDMFASDEMTKFNEKNKWGNNDDFYDEQLDLVLRLWGEKNGIGRLQLGVLRDFEDAFVNCTPVEEGNEIQTDEASTTIWIHNDNAQMLGRPCNHYSGVLLL